MPSCIPALWSSPYRPASPNTRHIHRCPSLSCLSIGFFESIDNFWKVGQAHRCVPDHFPLLARVFLYNGSPLSRWQARRFFTTSSTVAAPAETTMGKAMITMLVNKKTNPLSRESFPTHLLTQVGLV